MEQNRSEISAMLNAQTGRLAWAELERHFARGVVVKVAAELDLVEVASRLVQDDKAAVEAWLEDGTLSRATSLDAMDWNGRTPEFWAVVVAPWVLVQEALEQTEN